MNELTPQEVRDALHTIEETRRRLQRTLAHGGLPYFLLIWGHVWLVGFLADHFLPPGDRRLTWLWAGLVLSGMIASFAVGRSIGQRVRWPAGARMGSFWAAWVVYSALVIYFARPHGDQATLLISLLAMWGYVTLGIFFSSRFLASLGAWVTLLLVVGYLGVPALFSLWVALLGGGSLIGAGLYILYTWR